MGMLARTLAALRDRLSDGSESGCVCEPHPDCAQPLVRFVGPPGVGKTLAAYRLSMAAAMHHSLPLFVCDPKGDVSRYLDASRRQARRKDASERDAEVSEFIRGSVTVTCEPTGADVKRFLKDVHATVKSLKTRRPVAMLLVDEAGLLRRVKGPDGEHTGEEFWALAANLRNDCCTAFVTGHREFDVTPLGREATRVIIPFRSYDESSFFKVDYDQALFTPPMSDRLSFISSNDREVRSFEMPMGRSVDCARIPRALHQPTNVTRMEAVKV